jgi:UDP-N-acetylmuramoyl-L-alanyl-D-glutamate--2,6-diaminopimelate ligase
MKRIAISGSNGKSTTALWTAAAIDRDDSPAACIWSGGDLLHGRPVEVEHSMAGFLRFDAQLERDGIAALVVEVTSLALARGFADRWPCDVAVLTNVTHEHHDDHRSAAAYHRAKARLFDGLRSGGIAVFTASDPITVDLVARARSDIERRGYHLAHRPARAPAEFVATIRAMSWDHTRMTIESSAGRAARFSLTAPAPGDHFAENALAAWIAATAADFDPPRVGAAIAAASLPPSRFDVLARAPTVVVDYGHSPDALARTITTARGLTNGRVILVFGTHGLMDRPKRLAMGAAAGAADRIVLTTHSPLHADPDEMARELQEEMAPAARARTTVIHDRRQAITQAILAAEDGDTVLITGRGEESLHLVGDAQIPLIDREVALDALRLRGQDARGNAQ